jgi:hypothetical protein
MLAQTNINKQRKKSNSIGFSMDMDLAVAIKSCVAMSKKIRSITLMKQKTRQTKYVKEQITMMKDQMKKI